METAGEYLPFLTTYWAFAFGIAVSVYGTTVFFGRHLAPEAKENLTLWLWGEYDSTWTHQFCNLFDTVFGEKHLSWKCFLRSSVASIIAVLALYVLFAQILGVMGGRVLGNLPLWQAVLFGAAINIVPDYLSLFETRWLLKRFEHVHSVVGQLGVLLADALFTGAIIWIGINAFQLVRGNAVLSAVEMLALFSVFSVFFYSTFLTSVWAWVYCLSTWFMRLFSRTRLNTLLDVENKPVAQIALVGSALIFAAALALTPVLKTDKLRQASALDELLCSVFGGRLCIHVARLTDDEKLAFEKLKGFCEDLTDVNCGKRVRGFFNGNDARASAIWRKSCAGGYARGCRALGWHYSYGRGEAKDVAKATALYRQACDGGDAGGCTNLGNSYRSGLGVAKDETKALALYEGACGGGYMGACTNLGGMYMKGRGVAKDDAKAVALFRQGCEGGNWQGCGNLGFMYEKGRGVAKDDAKAVALYRQGCNRDHAQSCTRLGGIYGEGRGVAKDEAKAVALYRQGCDGGSARSCNKLGFMYGEGRGVAKDDAKAVALYRQACDGGSALGCSNLGLMYGDGRGVVKDEAKAVALYRQACDGGSARSCNLLGIMYDEGLGVARDEAKAVALYRQGCELGNEWACDQPGVKQ